MQSVTEDILSLDLFSVRSFFPWTLDSVIIIILFRRETGRQRRERRAPAAVYVNILFLLYACTYIIYVYLYVHVMYIIQRMRLHPNTTRWICDYVWCTRAVKHRRDPEANGRRRTKNNRSQGGESRGAQTPSTVDNDDGEGHGTRRSVPRAPPGQHADVLIIFMNELRGRRARPTAGTTIRAFDDACVHRIIRVVVSRAQKRLNFAITPRAVFSGGGGERSSLPLVQNNRLEFRSAFLIRFKWFWNCVRTSKIDTWPRRF